ncbi:MAG: neutral zinc metallopeptidase, partial [Pseudomonadaceae bacterium]
MRWQRGRRSDNVVDARGRSGRRLGGGLSLGGVAVIVIVGLLMGQDPLQILGQIAGQATQPQVTQTQGAPAANDEQSEFVRAILGDTEDTWSELFQQAGQQYRDPQLVLFSG